MLTGRIAFFIGLGQCRQAHPSDLGRHEFVERAPQEVLGGQMQQFVAPGMVVKVAALTIEFEHQVGNGVQYGLVVGMRRAQFQQRRRGTEQIFDPVPEQRPVDGLGDEVRGRYLVGAIDRLQIVLAGDHHDGQLGTGCAAQRSAHLVAIEHRHVDVQHHHVVGSGMELPQGKLAIDGQIDREAGVLQGRLHQQA